MNKQLYTLVSLAVILAALSYVMYTGAVGAGADIVAPSLDFIDQDGNEFNLSQLSGDVWVAAFVFSRCRGPCPVMLRAMYTLQDRIPPQVKLVSFSVDPEYDTPAVLKELAEVYKADNRRWHFLTGKKENVYSLAGKVLKLTLKETDSENPADAIIHDTRFVLFGKGNVVSGYYISDEEAELNRLVTDCTRLAH